MLPITILCETGKQSAETDLLKVIENDTHFMEKVIRGEEPRIFEYDPESDIQNAPQKHERAHPRLNQCSLFFRHSTYQLYTEFVLQGHNLGQIYCREVSETFRHSWVKTVISGMLHHDSAP